MFCITQVPSRDKNTQGSMWLLRKLPMTYTTRVVIVNSLPISLLIHYTLLDQLGLPNVISQLIVIKFNP
jgi:hypothetical protein